MKKSFSNGNGNGGSHGMAEGTPPQGPATMTITGTVLGENHWAKLA